MPSNYTEHYHLNQWEAGDQVLRTDFNADNAKIDGALGALEQVVTQQGSTLAGHTTSLARTGNCKLYTSSYSGNGSTSRSLSFPGWPVLVWVQETGAPHWMVLVPGASCGPNSGNEYTNLTWSAQSVSWTGAYSDRTAPLNSSGSRYIVVALLDASK